MGYKVNFENVQSVTIPDDEVVQLFADGVTSEYNFAKNDQRVINNAKELVFVINRDYVNSTSVENVSLYTRFKAGDIVSIELPNGVELYVPWKETPDSIDCNGLQEQWLANNYFLEDVDGNNVVVYIGKPEDKPDFIRQPKPNYFEDTDIKGVELTDGIRVVRDGKNMPLKDYIQDLVNTTMEDTGSAKRKPSSNKRLPYPDDEARDFVVTALHQKNVFLMDIANIAYSLEKDYVSGLTKEECLKVVYKVLAKRDVLSVSMVGLELDRLAEEGKLKEPLLSIIHDDIGLFPVDEVLGTAICNIFGLIGTTNYGFVDKSKSGKIKDLDQSKEHCNTFIDDIVGAIASAAAAKIAHDHNDDEAE